LRKAIWSPIAILETNASSDEISVALAGQGDTVPVAVWANIMVVPLDPSFRDNALDG
jgi:hypothetical protein